MFSFRPIFSAQLSDGWAKQHARNEVIDDVPRTGFEPSLHPSEAKRLIGAMLNTMPGMTTVGVVF